MIKVSTNNNKNGLAYSSKDINRNFRIKVSGVDAQGRKVHKLVGVAGAIALIGVEMLNKLLKRAFAYSNLYQLIFLCGIGVYDPSSFLMPRATKPSNLL